MFLEGKTTGTFKSIEEPVYVAFVSQLKSTSLCQSKKVLLEANFAFWLLTTFGL